MRKITRARALRMLRTLWCPLENPDTMLPVRHWRWMWLAVAARPVNFLIFLVLIGPYAIAQALIWLIDRAGGVGNVYAVCLRRDLNRSGWRRPRAPAPRVRQNRPPRDPQPGDLWYPWDDEPPRLWNGAAWAQLERTP